MSNSELQDETKTPGISGSIIEPDMNIEDDLERDPRHHPDDHDLSKSI